MKGVLWGRERRGAGEVFDDSFDCTKLQILTVIKKLNKQQQQQNTRQHLCKKNMQRLSSAKLYGSVPLMYYLRGSEGLYKVASG